MASFRSVNYSLRLNKAIERRLMFRALGVLSDVLPWKTYTYFGMGSMWFVDYVLAHRQLGIRRLVSCELDAIDAARARSNMPLAVVDVRSGDLGEHLQKVTLEKSKVAIWLDYDKPVSIESVDLVRDLSERMSDGSVLIITHPASFQREIKRTDKESNIRELFGAAVPHVTPASFFENRQLDKYPSNLATMLWALIEEAGNRRADRLRPKRLFSFVYGDGQLMATVGVVFASAKRSTAIEERLKRSNLGFVGDHITQLAVPLLTSREKGALDRLMPSSRGLSQKRAAKAGVYLSSDDLTQYRRWYADYPLFAEVDPR